MVHTHRSSDFLVVSTAIISVVFPALAARGEDAKAVSPGISAREAFASLKSLEGTWKNKVSHGDGHGPASDDKVIFKLTGAGSALVETDFPGSDHEMISVYHLDKDELRMTHYCAAGNQPRLKLDRAASTPSRLVFTFDGGSNLDPARDMHIHNMKMELLDGGSVKADWDAYAGGKKAETAHFQLSRESK